MWESKSSPPSNRSPDSIRCRGFLFYALLLAFAPMTLGCYNAVNLDGGGSSTFLVRTGDDYEVWNKQPGATIRKVPDGLAIIQK